MQKDTQAEKHINIVHAQAAKKVRYLSSAGLYTRRTETKAQPAGAPQLKETSHHQN
jgi:hypothetical protein